MITRLPGTPVVSFAPTVTSTLWT
ncbi:hypothetical protein Ocin01_12385 [Orchesella cincta]|uniref:Uncharacterized protein n=1 Tax=Orchesella cincta TaxID=48709 RepID=A0A1D2MN84_ORCCI|nr:hypothetical protein Ocin01_12385 [Orchesella cincta]